MSESQSQQSIERMLVRARNGAGADRDKLFESCRSYLGIVARAQVETWLRVKVDASDLVQQTMLEAHRDFDRFQGKSEGEWLAWLRRILRHNAADYVRRYHGAEKRRVGREVPLDSGQPSSLRAAREPADPGESPSQQLNRSERELQVAAALTRLTDDHRDVIMYRNLQRLPFSDVAQRMGRTRPATQMLWMRAMKKLETELAQLAAEQSLLHDRSTNVADDSQQT